MHCFISKHIHEPNLCILEVISAFHLDLTNLCLATPNLKRLKIKGIVNLKWFKFSEHTKQYKFERYLTWNSFHDSSKLSEVKLFNSILKPIKDLEAPSSLKSFYYNIDSSMVSYHKLCIWDLLGFSSNRLRILTLEFNGLQFPLQLTTMVDDYEYLENLTVIGNWSRIVLDSNLRTLSVVQTFSESPKFQIINRTSSLKEINYNSATNNKYFAKVVFFIRLLLLTIKRSVSDGFAPGSCATIFNFIHFEDYKPKLKTRIQRYLSGLMFVVDYFLFGLFGLIMEFNSHLCYFSLMIMPFLMILKIILMVYK